MVPWKEQIATVSGFGLLDAENGDSYRVWPQGGRKWLQLQGLASDSFDSFIRGQGVGPSLATVTGFGL